jgi:hypothetical protein
MANERLRKAFAAPSGTDFGKLRAVGQVRRYVRKRSKAMRALRVLHDCWQRESILYIEKSRSMITSWFMAGEALHYIMTHQPSTAIFWAQDQDRSVVLRDYVWTLYEQQDVVLRDLFPVPRPRIKQRQVSES